MCWCQKCIAQDWQQPGDKNMQIRHWLSQRQLLCLLTAHFSSENCCSRCSSKSSPSNKRSRSSRSVCCIFYVVQACATRTKRIPTGGPTHLLLSPRISSLSPSPVWHHTRANCGVLVSHMQKWAGRRLFARTTPAAESRFWQLPGSCSTIHHHGPSIQSIPEIKGNVFRHWHLTCSGTDWAPVKHVGPVSAMCDREGSKAPNTGLR